MSEARKILLVDDNRAVLRLLETILLLRGYRVIYACDGEEGVAMARQELPDLILLDVMMPNLDGFKACRILKDDPGTCDIPVIFLSARNEDCDAETARRAGATEFVRKPFKSQQILTLLERHLGAAAAI